MNKRRLIISILSVIAGLLFLSFLCMAILVKKNCLLGIDKTANSIVSSLRNDTLTEFVKLFTHIGSVLFLGLVVVFMFIFMKQPRAKIISVITLVLAGISCIVMKYIVQRGRPVGFGLIEEVGYSFPSAHATLTMVVFGFLIYYISKKRFNLILKIVVDILLLALIVLVSLSRVYLGVHFFTDILGAWLLGGMVFILTIIMYEFAFKKKNDEKK